jgi:N-acylneuraminate cytidylyltransferase
MSKKRFIQNLAIIPARSGSKRIPGKNIKPFLGIPLLSRVIQAADKSAIFDEIMVSTDTEEVRDLAVESGAKVPFFRSAENSDDFATLSQVLIEVLHTYIEQGVEVERCCCILPTAVFASEQLLSQGFKLLIDSGFDSVVPVVRYSHPIQRALVSNQGSLQFMHPQYRSTRTQDLEPTFHDSGLFYCLRTEAFLQSTQIFMEKTKAFEISESFCQDIDNELDWEQAELKYRIMQERGVIE